MWQFVEASPQHSNHNSEGNLHMFNKDTIAKTVFDMKTGKSDGFNGLSSDYFKHATDVLLYLSCLFNCILMHGFIPNSLFVSTLIFKKKVNKFVRFK